MNSRESVYFPEIRTKTISLTLSIIPIPK